MRNTVVTTAADRSFFFKQKVRLTNHEIKHAACFNDSEIDSRLSLIVLTAKSHSSDRNLRNYYRREANVLSMGLLRGCNQQREYQLQILQTTNPITSLRTQFYFRIRLSQSKNYKKAK